MKNPSDWKIAESGTTVYALTEEGFNAWSASVQSAGCTSVGEASEDECKEIARLMAAAPDLAKALKALIGFEAKAGFVAHHVQCCSSYEDRCNCGLDDALVLARSALDKVLKP